MASRELFDSFQGLLLASLIVVKPKVVVEYGPGISTGVILRNCDAQVYTYEATSSWYAQMAERFGGEFQEYADRLHLYLGNAFVGNGKREAYANAPLVNDAIEPGQVDLVFVDGRHRADCLIAASMLLKRGGVAVLHDSERPAYTTGSKAFKCFFDDAKRITSIYSKQCATIKKIREEYERILNAQV